MFLKSHVKELSILETFLITFSFLWYNISIVERIWTNDRSEKRTDKRFAVIRPTFYRHFQDKYEILEYILEKEIKDKIRVLIENDMEDDLLRLLFTCLSKDKEFYKRLYLIEGPNSFDHLMFQFIYDTLLRLLNKYPLKSPAKLQILSRETIARFYTFGLADSVKYAIMHDITYTPEEIAAAYDYLIHNSAFDLVEHPKIW